MSKEFLLFNLLINIYLSSNIILKRFFKKRESNINKNENENENQSSLENNKEGIDSKWKKLKGHQLKIMKDTFTILTVNDVYELKPNHQGVGGLSELTTLLKNEKLKTKNSIITLNGDFLSASVLAYKYKGSHIIDIFNKMPFDIITLGNHECK
jgi:2',3'-cyclic-nucleotide 2'-phosphodiesterase (5'-nucleotidase family)